MVRRLLRGAALWGAVSAGLLLLFTSRPLYSIISLAATGMVVADIWLMIQSVNRIFSRGRGRFWFDSLALAKLALIALAFYAVSRISEGAVLSFLAGVSALPLALMSEGARLLIRGARHGT